MTAILVSVLPMTSCNSGKDRQLAEQGVTRFHARFNAEQYHLIYTESDDGFRQATSEPDLIALLQAIHRKLGAAGQSHQRSFQVGYFAGQGTRVTLVCDTEFENDTGNEQFIWHIIEGQPLLVGYHVNSKALILR